MIPFIQYNRFASVHIEVDKVMYFVTIDNDDITILPEDQFDEILGDQND